MDWNLPPGVSVNDYHIGGPLREWQAEATCPNDHTASMLHEWHPQIGHIAYCPIEGCEYGDGFEINDEEIDEMSLAHDAKEMDR